MFMQQKILLLASGLLNSSWYFFYYEYSKYSYCLAYASHAFIGSFQPPCVWY